MTAASHDIDLMTRREALRRVSALLGGAALVGETAWLAACASSGAPRAGNAAPFSAADIALLDEIAETILPETSTPGARAAGVGPFIATMVADTYDPRELRAFRDGLKSLERESAAQLGVAFMAATSVQRRELLERLDHEQHEDMRARAPGDTRPAHYFRMLKELALLGYFTSEIGYTQAMRYAETPGRFDPCVPHTAGERAWAPHA
jgi:hypothetical protein